MSYVSGSPAFDDSKILDNLGLLSFQVMEAASVAGVEKYVDFFSDQFEDNSGIDAAASVDELYDASNDKWGVVGSTVDDATQANSISGGDYLTYAKEKAFDNAGNAWICSQAYGGISGVAYIGQNFGSEKKLVKFTIQQSTNGDWRISSAKVQYSDNGSAWSDLETFALVNDSAVNTHTLSAHSQSHAYWRILANAEPYSGAARWEVLEVEMMVEKTGFTLVSNSVEAETNDPSLVRLLLAVDLNSVTITVNTDLIGYVSINDGANYEAIPLTYRGLDGTGRAVYSGEVSPTARADKTIRAKIVVSNSKNIYLRSWAVLWQYS